MARAPHWLNTPGRSLSLGSDTHTGARHRSSLADALSDSATTRPLIFAMTCGANVHTGLWRVHVYTRPLTQQTENQSTTAARPQLRLANLQFLARLDAPCERLHSKWMSAGTNAGSCVFNSKPTCARLLSSLHTPELSHTRLYNYVSRNTRRDISWEFRRWWKWMDCAPIGSKKYMMCFEKYSIYYFLHMLIFWTIKKLCVYEHWCLFELKQNISKEVWSKGWIHFHIHFVAAASTFLKIF